MIIRLKDGSEKEYAQPMSVLDIAKDTAKVLQEMHVQDR